MPPELNLEEAGVPELIQGIQGLLFAPIAFSIKAAIDQPVVKAAIKQGVALSERSQEAIAEAGEVFEDLVAEVKDELVQQRRRESSEDTITWARSGESEAAVGLIDVLSTLNEQIGRATNGVADLRLLVPVGFSTLALRQLIVNGLEIDEIPWYTLAWYAFDSFVKLNRTDTPPTLYPVSDSETMQAAENSG